jgi:Winged helix-turn helix
MSGKELRRAGVLARVKSGELKLGNAAVMMGLSYRQTKRLAKRYREEGAQGLKHGSAGRGVEPKEAAEIPGTSFAVSGQEVFRGGRRAVRADVSGRTLGE